MRLRKATSTALHVYKNAPLDTRVYFLALLVILLPPGAVVVVVGAG
jgi:hypothetical protein